MAANKLKARWGNVRVIGDDDWISHPPDESADVKTKLDWLEQGPKFISDAAERAKQFGAKKRKQAAEQAQAVAEAAKKTLKKIASLPAEAVQEVERLRTKTMQGAYDRAADAAKTTLGVAGLFGAGILGGAVLWWVVVGVGAYVYFTHEKSGAKQ